MIEAFLSGGIFMWPLLAIGIGVLALSGKTGLLLFRDGEHTIAHVERKLQGILFWGTMSVVLGLLGTVVGILQMAQAVMLAGGVEAPMIWGGLAVALVTLIFGLMIFLVAALFWYALRQTLFWGMRRATT